ncbi:MAG: DUF4956 domain-containing protein [Flavobacteriales bacterium]|nr:DUF4956 domain-containing protein [Flavobacteriales bacterium]
MEEITTELFGTELIDSTDLIQLVFRFLFNGVFLFILVRLLYYPSQKRKDFLFTFMILNILIFFISFLLSSVKLQLGFAFGLFAVFSVLRYRTEALPIKEMTYLFTVIGLAVINAVSNKKISWAELMFTNMAIVGTVFVLEKLWLLRHETQRMVIYDNLELLKPENGERLLEDLHQRTGLRVTRYRIERFDLLRDVANISIYYFEDGNTGYQKAAGGDDDDED